MRNNPIGIFDSGVGGLNVLKKCVELLPDERFIYLADSANMPYGGKSEDDIRRLACACAERLFARNCKAIVIACNTATAAAAEYIRTLFPARIVIGLAPAVKPCFRELGRCGYAVALVTDATGKSASFNRLISECDGKVVPCTAPMLAELIERNPNGASVVEQYLREVLGRFSDAEAIVLGCSHYVYTVDIIKRIYNNRIKIYDGADGAVARLKYCLTVSDLIATEKNATIGIEFLSTTKQSGIM